jgi:hypothetical protein
VKIAVKHRASYNVGNLTIYSQGMSPWSLVILIKRFLLWLYNYKCVPTEQICVILNVFYYKRRKFTKRRNIMRYQDKSIMFRVEKTTSVCCGNQA